MASSSSGKNSSRRAASTLQKIAQKKEQLKQLPRMKKLERISAHLSCQVKTKYTITYYICQFYLRMEVVLVKDGILPLHKKQFVLLIFVAVVAIHWKTTVH